MPPIVTRFAPSPTGPLHLGHARAAIFAHDLARRLGGRFLLRIEDIDATRCRPDGEAAIVRDLDWLGLRVDGPVRRQSDHTDRYRAVLGELAARGLVYPCFCTRAAIAREIAASAGAPHDPDGAPLYPGTCRTRGAAERADRIARGEPHAWRLDMTAAIRSAPTGSAPTENAPTGSAPNGPALHRVGLDGRRTVCHPERFGDVVLGRRDAPASYHLCATHDDAASGVTLVTRGTDLEPASDLHRLLQTLMGWPAPRYGFHPLLTDASGRRLSKRDGAASLAAMRAAAVAPAEIRRLAGVDALVDHAAAAAAVLSAGDKRSQIELP